VNRLETRLSEFSSTIRSLSGPSGRPKTAFELLEQSRYEDAWQAYLGYFLDPGEDHGLESQFLNEFFKVSKEHGAISFTPPQTGLDSAEMLEVILERQSDNGNRPDIVITSGEEWFLCIELKVHSSEGGGESTQTVRYAEDVRIVEGGTETYEEGEYVYLKPNSKPNSTSDRFGDLNWENIQTAIDRTITKNAGRVPAPTLVQLSDFSTLIESQLNMTNLDKETRRRKDLYFEYRDEISKAQEAVKPFVKSILQQGWGEALEDKSVPKNVEEFQWRYQALGKGYGQIRPPRWEKAKSGSEALDIHWEHKPTEGDFIKGRLRFILELEEPDRSTIDSSSGERYLQFRKDIVDRIEDTIKRIDEPRWKEYDVDPGRSKKKIIRLVYTYPPGDEDGYYESLQYALEDTGHITRLVTELLESTNYTEFDIE